MTEDKKSVCKPTVFEELYKKHSKDVFNFMFYKTGSKANAEDLLQEAFVKLWKNCEKVAYEKAKSFLFTVSSNLFLNEKKHEKVVHKYIENQNKSSYKDNDTPENVLRQKEFQDKLNNAIASLSEKQREVFLMSRIDKKKYAEIAETLGISVKAVEKRMHNALVILRDKIGKI
ncbi:RNA polymerase sigma factor [Aureivirga sp. CE67]|uniref:RNA polymerase sigma factor n=1 Tax=Aureivirga sp. CE67 TaxID=1788983 RepID=UPI0018CADF93|nr:RNA polymerase sigma-70 factor [Aureivirga sp. CE67]